MSTPISIISIISGTACVMINRSILDEQFNSSNMFVCCGMIYFPAKNLQEPSGYLADWPCFCLRCLQYQVVPHSQPSWYGLWQLYRTTSYSLKTNFHITGAHLAGSLPFNIFQATFNSHQFTISIHFQILSPSSLVKSPFLQGGALPVISCFINPSNFLVISTINHSEIGLINQLNANIQISYNSH